MGSLLDPLLGDSRQEDVHLVALFFVVAVVEVTGSMSP